MSLKWILLIFVLGIGAAASAEERQAAPEGGLLRTTPAVYPVPAKAAGIEGKVVLKGLIGADGVMRDVRAVKGPGELRQAAIDAVSNWAYRPYTNHGIPVEVSTTVTVNFTLGDKKQKAAFQAAAKPELLRSAQKDAAIASPSNP